MKFVFITFALVLLCGSIQAKDPIQNFTNFCINNTCVEAKGNVWLRDSPPSGIFYTKGEKLDVVAESEILVIKEKKEIKSLFRKYEWLKVERIAYKKDGSKIEIKMTEGWVYNGKVDGKAYFELTKISNKKIEGSDK